MSNPSNLNIIKYEIYKDMSKSLEWHKLDPDSLIELAIQHIQFILF